MFAAWIIFILCVAIGVNTFLEFESFRVRGAILILLSAIIGAVFYWGCDEKCIGHVLLLNAGAMTLAFPIGFIIDAISGNDKYGFNDIFSAIPDVPSAWWVYSIISIICMVIFTINCADSYKNFVISDTPVVKETRYVLYDATEDGDDDSVNLFYVMERSSEHNNGFYRFYYAQEKENGEIKVFPYEIPESNVEIIVDSSGFEKVTEDYLIKITTTYYGKYKNDKEFVFSECDEYKLYLREATFENMTVIMND